MFLSGLYNLVPSINKTPPVECSTTIKYFLNRRPKIKKVDVSLREDRRE
jgi:hypothetical protein